MTASSVLNVQLKKLHPDAIVPKFQTQGAAGFDLHALVLGKPDSAGIISCIHPGESLKVKTGIAVSTNNPDWGLFLFPRSSLGAKGIRLANCVGIIDSDYQGELLVILRNDSNITHIINPGDRIAQGVFMPVRQAQFIEVEEFSATTERGTKGFGSTGN